MKEKSASIRRLFGQCVGDPGTTIGNYTVTITGAAPGATTATATIGVTID